ncbi:MAG: hypothetical protein AAGB93_08260 [Planctomycetota bacterium]
MIPARKIPHIAAPWAALTLSVPALVLSSCCAKEDTTEFAVRISVPQPVCDIEDIPFVIHYHHPTGLGPLEIAPPSVPRGPMPPATLRDPYGLLLTPLGQSPFQGDPHGFSVGADWIRFEDGTPQDLPVGGGTKAWVLDPLVGTDEEGEGWAILFYLVDNTIYAMGWSGGSSSIPANSLLIARWGDDPRINRLYTPLAERTPLHAHPDLVSTEIYAMDFSGGALVEMGALAPDCGWNPDLRNGVAYRHNYVYYSLENSASIWRVAPVLVGGTWEWGIPEEIFTAANLGLQSGSGSTPSDDIVALSVDVRSGFLMFGLSEDSPSHSGEPLFGARVDLTSATPTVDQVLPVWAPDPEGGDIPRPLSSTIGPRVRGVCKIDPRLLLVNTSQN